MDDKSNQLLQELVNQQKKQTDLLQQNLGRMRFSLRALLIVMTLMAVGLGYLGYKQQQAAFFMPVPASPYAPPASRTVIIDKSDAPMQSIPMQKTSESVEVRAK